jgi:ankyrin repeat protein
LLILKASRNGHLEVVNELLNSNANIEAKNDNGDTPLIIGKFFHLLFTLSIG